MQLPDWFELFKAVCFRGEEALKWGLPEPWIHAELYRALTKDKMSGWEPLDTEVPYVTNYPVRLPKEANRDWRTESGIKWVDLCLKSVGNDTWCWFEFKVRHVARGDDRIKEGALEARDVFRKDVVALAGFDALKTAETWENPGKSVKAYYLDYLLKPNARSICIGRHLFVAAFLQLGGKLDEEVWSEKALMKQIFQWEAYRCKQARLQPRGAGFNPLMSHKRILDNNWLVVLQWGGRVSKNGM